MHKIQRLMHSIHNEAISKRTPASCGLSTVDRNKLDLEDTRTSVEEFVKSRTNRTDGTQKLIPNSSVDSKEPKDCQTLPNVTIQSGISTNKRPSVVAVDKTRVGRLEKPSVAVKTGGVAFEGASVLLTKRKYTVGAKDTIERRKLVPIGAMPLSLPFDRSRTRSHSVPDIGRSGQSGTASNICRHCRKEFTEKSALKVHEALRVSNECKAVPINFTESPVQGLRRKSNNLFAQCAPIHITSLNDNTYQGTGGMLGLNRSENPKLSSGQLTNVSRRNGHVTSAVPPNRHMITERELPTNMLFRSVHLSSSAPQKELQTQTSHVTTTASQSGYLVTATPPVENMVTSLHHGRSTTSTFHENGQMIPDAPECSLVTTVGLQSEHLTIQTSKDGLVTNDAALDGHMNSLGGQLRSPLTTSQQNGILSTMDGHIGHLPTRALQSRHFSTTSCQSEYFTNEAPKRGHQRATRPQHASVTTNIITSPEPPDEQLIYTHLQDREQLPVFLPCNDFFTTTTHESGHLRDPNSQHGYMANTAIPGGPQTKYQSRQLTGDIHQHRRVTNTVTCSGQCGGNVADIQQTKHMVTFDPQVGFLTSAALSECLDELDTNAASSNGRMMNTMRSPVPHDEQFTSIPHRRLVTNFDTHGEFVTTEALSESSDGLGMNTPSSGHMTNTMRSPVPHGENFAGIPQRGHVTKFDPRGGFVTTEALSESSDRLGTNTAACAQMISTMISPVEVPREGNLAGISQRGHVITLDPQGGFVQTAALSESSDVFMGMSAAPSNGQMTNTMKSPLGSHGGNLADIIPQRGHVTKTKFDLQGSFGTTEALLESADGLSTCAAPSDEFMRNALRSHPEIHGRNLSNVSQKRHVATFHPQV